MKLKLLGEALSLTYEGPADGDEKAEDVSTDRILIHTVAFGEKFNSRVQLVFRQGLHSKREKTKES